MQRHGHRLNGTRGAGPSTLVSCSQAKGCLRWTLSALNPRLWAYLNMYLSRGSCLWQSHGQHCQKYE